MLEIERARQGQPRSMAFVGIAAAAAVVLAFCLYDASAEIGIGTPPTTQRATVGAW